MGFKFLLIVLSCLSLGVRSLEPLFAHADQHLITNEEDDSARCRLSGICEGRPTVEECLHGADDHGPSSAAASIPSYAFAARRDASLACEFTTTGRAERVRDAARWTWKGYKECAHGSDELRPLSCKGQEWHNLQLTPVDAMDTLALMNLHEEFNEALHLVKESLKPTEECNVFETTIRILGGLLSTHNLVSANYNKDLDGDGHLSTSLDLLDAAVDVGSRLLHAFNSPSGIPYSDINLETGSIARSAHHSSMAESTTLSLEFTLLSRLTGEETFEKAAMAVHRILTSSVDKYDGLLAQFVSPVHGTSNGDYFMLGARSDSYYEYLLKQWILTGQTDELMLSRYKQAMRAVRKRLLRRTGGLLYIAEETGKSISPKMDHLVCFLPGVLALGDFYNVSTTSIPENTTTTSSYYQQISDLELAEHLAETCYQIYRRTPTGLAPEIVFFTEDDEIAGSESASTSTTSTESATEYPGAHTSDIGGGVFTIKEDDAHNLLRPETVESLFILWKVTGNSKYQEQAWLIFRAFERWTRVEGVQQCLAVDPEAAAGTANREVATVAALEAARALAASRTSEQAIKQGIDAAKAALQAMGLDTLHKDGAEEDAAQIRLIENACLAAAEAAATATVQMMMSSNATYSLDDIPDLFEIERTIDSSTSGQARFCDWATLRGGGYSNLESVKSIPPPRRDKMESFWIAETLKYLYLIFTEPPDRCLYPTCSNNEAAGEQQKAVLPLTEFVFNTEAHPLPIVGPTSDSRVKPVFAIDRSLLNPYEKLSGDVVHLQTEEVEEEDEDGEEDGEGVSEEDLETEDVDGSDDYVSGDSAGEEEIEVEVDGDSVDDSEEKEQTVHDMNMVEVHHEEL